MNWEKVHVFNVKLVAFDGKILSYKLLMVWTLWSGCGFSLDRQVNYS